MEEFELFINNNFTGFILEDIGFISKNELLKLHKDNKITPIEMVDEETYIVKKNGQLVELMFA